MYHRCQTDLNRRKKLQSYEMGNLNCSRPGYANRSTLYPLQLDKQYLVYRSYNNVPILLIGSNSLEIRIHESKKKFTTIVEMTASDNLPIITLFNVTPLPLCVHTQHENFILCPYRKHSITARNERTCNCYKSYRHTDRPNESIAVSVCHFTFSPITEEQMLNYRTSVLNPGSWTVTVTNDINIMATNAINLTNVEQMQYTSIVDNVQYLFKPIHYNISPRCLIFYTKIGDYCYSCHKHSF